MSHRKSRLVKLVEKLHIPVDKHIQERYGRIQATKERYSVEQRQKAAEAATAKKGPGRPRRVTLDPSVVHAIGALEEAAAAPGEVVERMDELFGEGDTPIPATQPVDSDAPPVPPPLRRMSTQVDARCVCSHRVPLICTPPSLWHGHTHMRVSTL